MIINRLIPYLRSEYGEKVLYFFSPDAYLEKQDWTCYKNKKVIKNPLNKNLDDLYDGNTDYNFSVFGEVAEEDKALSVDMTDNIPKAAVDLTQIILIKL